MRAGIRTWPPLANASPALLRPRMFFISIRKTYMLLRNLHRFAAPCLRRNVITLKAQQCHQRRTLVTLAIESSCDDTSVAIAELPSGQLDCLEVHFHEKITANNDAFTGIHPLVALHSHRQNLAPLVRKALHTWSSDGSRKPTFVSVTRGPGMRSNLQVGLELAKGLSVAWDVPILGVHHMQAHALTPRLVTAMNRSDASSSPPHPSFPFLTVLASGGHTMLIDSAGLTEHTILAETQDIAIGDCLDKAARAILLDEALKMPFGKALEDFAFPECIKDYQYIPPARRQEELERKKTDWNWSLRAPFSESKAGPKTSRRMAYSFAGLLSSIERFVARKVDRGGRLLDETRSPDDISGSERRDMAREVQRVAFEHLASRILLHLSTAAVTNITSVVVSGGVASNSYMRHVLRAMLDARGYRHIDLAFPPINLCTDNALMIAWAAFEMWHAGYRSTLDIEPIRKWSMDPNSEDGGILGVGGWTTVS